MASQDDIKRLTRRSEALKSLQLGECPVIDPGPFDRFPEMSGAIRTYNEQMRMRDLRLKNLLSEALLSARDLPP